MRRVDLNCDLGEGAGHDAELMPLITSANIACGGHAGDEATMRATVTLAKAHGVAVGAHPGYPDRKNFGRRELRARPDEVMAWVTAQILALQHVAQGMGVSLVHVKPHGALYNQSARDRALADAVAQAVQAIDPGLVLVGPAGSELMAAGRRLGLTVAREAFADRAYRADDTLVPRSDPQALVADPEQVKRQVLRLVRDGVVGSVEGHSVAVTADTICLHGDGDHAVEFARTLRAALAGAGIAVERFSKRNDTR
ncbi:MAG: 5-oxoprolinase subunit PxpA [Opitutales bacterium]